MGRSVYSLVLSDDVIRAVDRAAYAMNTSRSNLINQILAEYVSYTTPEKRMKDIFDSLTAMIGGSQPFLIQSQGSDALLNIRSPLQVKYNPTIKYTVELFRDKDSGVGELRIMTRTQSGALLEQLRDFFLLFCQVETAFFQRAGQQPPHYEIDRGRLIRTFALLHPGCSNEEIGGAIGRYIKTVDGALKEYLACRPEQRRSAVEQIYGEYFREGQTIL